MKGRLGRRGARAMVPAPLGPGDPVPELTLTDTRGTQVQLAALGGVETLLIFLRHLA